MSKGALKLRQLLLEIFGDGVRLEEEHHVGENLRLDFFLPDYKVATEMHGQQHRVFCAHFHVDAAGFADSQRRDRRKLELCAEQGIAVAVFWDDEELTTRIVAERTRAAVLETNTLLKELLPDLKKDSASEWRSEQYQKYKESKFHEQALERAREARKERYQWMKQHGKK